MNLTDLLAITGLPGLYKMIGNRTNGLIVEQLGTGKRRFVSARRHQFSPLESISIYTLGDTVPLREIFLKMQKAEKTLPVVSHKADSYALYEYFEQILPDFDEDRVKANDIKKIVRWYSLLGDLDLLNADEEE